MRQEINLEDSFENFTHVMAEENPEAAKIIEKIIVKFRGNAVNILLLLCDMNIRGTQICFLVNSICKGDLDLFFSKLTSDPALAVEVNNIAKRSNIKERARSAENNYIISDRN